MTLELLENRAIGTMIAMAGIQKITQRLRHGLKLGDLGFDIRQMAGSQSVHVLAGARPIAPKVKQAPDLFERKAEIARGPDETKLVDIAFVIIAIPVVPAGTVRDYDGRDVHADHFGGNAACKRCCPDLHELGPQTT